MECVVCGQEAGYHRAVIDEVEDRRIGGLCRDCERTEFGRSLQRGHFRETEGCILCARDGHYALPLGEPTATRNEEGRVVGSIDYDVGAETVRLCDEHLHGLAAATPDPSEGRLRREFW